MTPSGDNRRGRGWVATPLVRLAAFAALLLALAGVAALVGRASGLEADEPAGHEAAEETGHAGEALAGAVGNGLSDTGSGLRLQLAPMTLKSGGTGRLKLSIVDRRNQPLQLHGSHGEPPLHLILVRRDLGGYQHLHPRRSGKGFVVDVTLGSAGAWRAYADFEVEDEKVVLGRDLFVSGDFRPQSLPPVADAARAGGYDVQLSQQDLAAGSEETLRFRISRSGEAVTDLEPYLGAAGHLVAIREDDLTYLHVHPLESSARGGIDFGAGFAEPGRYGLFLQFKHEGRVQTARFTVEVA